MQWLSTFWVSLKKREQLQASIFLEAIFPAILFSIHLSSLSYILRNEMVYVPKMYLFSWRKDSVLWKKKRVRALGIWKIGR